MGSEGVWCGKFVLVGRQIRRASVPFSPGLSRVPVALLLLLCALAMHGARLPWQDSKGRLWFDVSAVETLATAPAVHFRGLDLDIFHYLH